MSEVEEDAREKGIVLYMQVVKSAPNVRNAWAPKLRKAGSGGLLLRRPDLATGWIEGSKRCINLGGPLLYLFFLKIR